jgi:hypothetical protein
VHIDKKRSACRPSLMKSFYNRGRQSVPAKILANGTWTNIICPLLSRFPKICRLRILLAVHLKHKILFLMPRPARASSDLLSHLNPVGESACHLGFWAID